MRKILAVLLTVLMLCSVMAAFPVSAAADASADSPSKIIITEIGANVKANAVNGVAALADALDYVEIHNISNATINLNTIALARATNYTSKPKVADGDIHFVTDTDTNWSTWNNYKFLSKIVIQSGLIVDDTPYVEAEIFEEGYIFNYEDGGLNLSNEHSDMQLPAGETAIIWLIGPETLTWLANCRSILGVTNYNPVDCFLAQFYPNADAATLASLKNRVVMVWAYSNAVVGNDKQVATDMFKMDVPEIAAKAEKESYVYGLVNSDWNLSTAAYTNAGWNEDVYCVARYGAQLDVNYTGNTNTATNSASYLPAKYEPFLYNAELKFKGKTNSYTDYYLAEIATSYRECALVDMAKDLTPGKLTDWQWAFVDASKLPTGTTADAAKTAFVDLFGYNASDDLEDGGRVEPDIEVNPPKREDLLDIFYNNDDEEEKDEGGLPGWALALIIVGGVLVVGGVVCVVLFVVVLPKKKAAAAAAEEASAEGAASTDENKEE